MAKGRKTQKTRDPKPGEAKPGEELLPSGKLYYRIGEVSDITGVKTYVLRYWESEFRGMVPQKSRSKQRLYKRRDIEMILLIKKLLYEERYTIAGARQRIKELNAAKGQGVAPAEPPAPPAESQAEPSASAEAEAAVKIDHLAEYRRIKDELLAIRASL